MKRARMRRARRFAAGAGVLAACSVMLACWGGAGALASAPDPGLGVHDALAGAAGQLAAPGAPGAESVPGSGDIDFASSSGAASEEAAPLSASEGEEEEGGEGALAGDTPASDVEAAGGDAQAEQDAGMAAESPAPQEGEAPSAKVAVGPWFARFDVGAVERAQAAAAVAFAEEASVRAGLAASLFAAVATMCAAVAAACFIMARSFARPPRPFPRGARANAGYVTMPDKRPIVTRRKEI